MEKNIKNDEKEKLIELLDYICCPKCRGDLKLEEEKEEMFYLCKQCGKKYVIKEGIPILLTEEDYEEYKPYFQHSS